MCVRLSCMIGPLILAWKYTIQFILTGFMKLKKLKERLTNIWRHIFIYFWGKALELWYEVKVSVRPMVPY